MKSSLVVIGVVALVTTALSFTLQQVGPWKVPKKYENMKTLLYQTMFQYSRARNYISRIAVPVME